MSLVDRAGSFLESQWNGEMAERLRRQIKVVLIRQLIWVSGLERGVGSSPTLIIITFCSSVWIKPALFPPSPLFRRCNFTWVYSHHVSVCYLFGFNWYRTEYVCCLLGGFFGGPTPTPPVIIRTSLNIVTFVNLLRAAVLGSQTFFS